jgi:hypothetical protein
MNERQLEKYKFDPFMPVFCVLTVEILKVLIPYVTEPTSISWSFDALFSIIL